MGWSLCFYAVWLNWSSSTHLRLSHLHISDHSLPCLDNSSAPKIFLKYRSTYLHPLTIAMVSNAMTSSFWTVSDEQYGTILFWTLNACHLVTYLLPRAIWRVFLILNKVSPHYNRDCTFTICLYSNLGYPGVMKNNVLTRFYFLWCVWKYRFSVHVYAQST